MFESLNLKTDFPQRFFFPLEAIRIMPLLNPLEVLTVLPCINLIFKMKNSNYQGRDLLFKT